MTQPRKIPAKAGFEPSTLEADALTPRPTRRSYNRQNFFVLSIFDVEEDTDMDTLISAFNTAVTNSSSVIFCKHHHGKEPYVTAHS